MTSQGQSETSLQPSNSSNLLKKSSSAAFPKYNSLSAGKKEEEEISSHLMEPEADMEDCYGPVPPTTDEPGVYTDPFTQDYHVIPNPAIPGRSR